MSRQARRAFLVAILLLMSCARLPAQEAPKVPTEQEQEAGHGDDPRGREEWFLQGRTVPGKSAAELRLRAFRQKMTARAAAAARTAAAQRSEVQIGGSVAGGTGPQWQNLGPAPIISTPGQSYGAISGRLTSVAVDQTDATGNTVYIGAAYGGVWKSTNATASPSAVVWTPLTEDQASLAIGAIAISPADHNLLLVGTGEANGSADSYYGVGILRSTDGGGTWTLISSADGGSKPLRGLAVSHIAFSSDNPSLVVVSTTAAGHGSTIGAETSGSTTASRGLYYSTDAGQTWHFVSLSDSGTALASNSAHSVVYNPIQKKFYAVVRAHGVYSSSDGQTWTKLATQPSGVTPTACPPTTNLTTCPIYRGEFGIRPGSDEMYLWFVNSSEADGGIFRTLDGGQTWTSIHTGGGSDGISSCGDGSNCGTAQGAYNLYMAAVPNPTGSDPNQTDVYAGAINIYKCTIPGSNKATATCSTWLNLTHVYSCNPTAAPSHVHPDQHGIDFSLANPHILYFGHDGGVSRTLNGPGLNSGSCSGNNPFDNLTGTLGSTSEFVSISQNPNDDSVILGGTQDNGSPALFPGFAGNTNGVTWNQVQGGDGGYNEIDPNASNVWYASTTRINITRCTAGSTCTDPQFTTVVGSSNVGGDTGLFYTPYLLDPQATTSLIIGTCRVWRGVVSGTSFSGTALSNNLSNPASTVACTTSDDLIRAVAAGGPNGSGGSQVIYAGTNAGRIFVTTSASAGASSWVERTGGINPSFYPISSFYVDTNDASGQTAYVTVMGFGTGHIFKTTNAGVTWTQMDASGSGLPDSPANTVIVDPITPNIVYVGTDVGVFLTRDGSTWSEYGAGMPNVPVSRLRVFNNCGVGKFLLRASTYGRGVWQVPLASVPAGTDFTLAVSPGSTSIFPGQTASFTTTLQSFNGYNSSVTLSCTTGSPSTCTGTSLIPTGCGAPATVRASDTRTQDFNFTIQARGTDGTTHTQAATLRVVDFAVAKPASFNVLVGNSASTPVTVSGLGSFSGTVTLSCSALSTTVGCTVSPASVNPTAASPAAPSLTATAANNSLIGVVAVTVTANSAGAPAAKTQTFNINVTDFAVSATTSSQTVRAGSPATYTLGLAPVTGSASVDSAVTLTCSGLPSLAACSFDKTSYTPGTGTTATMTITTTAATITQPGSPLALWLFRLPLLGLLGAAFLPRDRKRRRNLLLVMFLVAVVALLIVQVSCGGGGGSSGGGGTTHTPGTPAGTYTVTVTGSAGTASRSTTVTLVVQ